MSQKKCCCYVKFKAASEYKINYDNYVCTGVSILYSNENTPQRKKVNETHFSGIYFPKWHLSHYRKNGKRKNIAMCTFAPSFDVIQISHHVWRFLYNFSLRKVVLAQALRSMLSISISISCFITSVWRIYFYRKSYRLNWLFLKRFCSSKDECFVL